MSKKEEKKTAEMCDACGEPGGRLRVDPYQLELYGERVVMRLHSHCYQERCDDI